MLADDEEYMNSILKEFGVTKYKLSETPTRFKLILQPDSFTMKTLDSVQRLRGSIGIEIDIRKGVYLECLKDGNRRKRRRLCVDVFKGAIPKEYEVGKYNKVMRQLLGMDDVCAFKAKVVDDTLEVRDIECLTYGVLKRISDMDVTIVFDMAKAKISMTL